LEAKVSSVGSFEAKTHLAALLDRVANGETVEITRRGVPVARLVPAGAGHPEDLKKVAREIRDLRRGNRLGGLKIRELINEGRRF
jgi:prevent-host-death family protein